MKPKFAIRSPYAGHDQLESKAILRRYQRNHLRNDGQDEHPLIAALGCALHAT
jgi:hypothetical protein